MTWEMVNKLIKNEKDLDDLFILIAGTIGSEVTSDFISFTKVMQDVPSYEDIINDFSIEPPSTLSHKWASICLILEHINIKDLNKILTYINKFPKSMIAMFFKYLCKKDSKYLLEPEVSKLLIELSEYINKYE